jgi:hypothetical protein
MQSQHMDPAEAVRAKGGDASRTVVLAIGEQWHVPKRAAETR